LFGLNVQPACIGAVRIFHFSSALAVFGMEEVAQDREEPGIQIRPALEPMKVRQRSQQCVLNEIVGSIHLPG